MTKVYLHGGNSTKNSEKNKLFFEELINSVDKDEMNVLCVYFARPEYRWEDSYAEDQSIFFARGLELGKDIVTKMATYDMEELKEDIKKADIVFINGGMKGHLKSTLEKIGDIRAIFSGKVVVGISAGANNLCKYYHSIVAEDIREGIGLLDYKIITHFNDDHLDKEKIMMLEDYKEVLPLLKIQEEEYLFIEL
jgi:peptidase E